MWSLAAIICEVDMKLDGYYHTKTEVDAREKCRTHKKNKGTCETLKRILDVIIKGNRNDPIMEIEELRKFVGRIKF
jgi:hypothetical protein